MINEGGLSIPEGSILSSLCQWVCCSTPRERRNMSASGKRCQADNWPVVEVPEPHLPCSQLSFLQLLKLVTVKNKSRSETEKHYIFH